jgi:uncharacterized membrane protein
MNAKSFFLILIFTLLTVAAVGLDQLTGGSLLFLRVPLSLLFIAFVPGYAFQAALLPKPAGFTGLERLALSIGMSVAILSPLALILNATNLGIRLWPVLLSLSGLTILFAGIAWLRRRLLPRDQVDEAAPFRVRQWWSDQPPLQRRLWIGGTLLMVAVTTYVVISLALPKPGDYLTEFYIVGPSGAAEDYPRQGTAGQPLTLHLGVTNREGQDAIYLITATAGGQIVGWKDPFALQDGQTQNVELSITLPNAGMGQEVTLTLVRDGFPSPYRELTIWLDVNP